MILDKYTDFTKHIRQNAENDNFLSKWKYSVKSSYSFSLMNKYADFTEDFLKILFENISWNQSIQSIIILLKDKLISRKIKLQSHNRRHIYLQLFPW